MNAASNIPVVAMLPLDWVRSASAWSCRSSSRSRPNVGGARSPLTPLDAARTTANREGAASGRRLHPTRATRGATVSGSATAKAISLTSRPAPAHQRSPLLPLSRRLSVAGVAVGLSHRSGPWAAPAAIARELRRYGLEAETSHYATLG